MKTSTLFVITVYLYGAIFNFPVQSSEDAHSSKLQYKPFGILHTLQNLSKWHAKEEQIAESLSKRLKLIDEEIKLITKYLKDYNESTGEAMRQSLEPKETPEERGKIVGKSAVLGHRMTHRYATILADIRKFLQSPDYNQNQDLLRETLDLKENPTEIFWVGSGDFFVSMMTIIHQQEVYMLEPKEIVQGLGRNSTSGEQLNAVHCVTMGIFALYWKRHYMSVEWLEYGHKLMRENFDYKFDTYSASPNLVLFLLKLAIQEHNKAYQSIKSRKIPPSREIVQNLFTKPIFPSQIPTEKLSARKMLFHKYRGKNFYTRFQDLCLGNTLQTPEVQSKLKCYYKSSQHPFLRINPLKVEILSETPPIFQFYDMISESNASKLLSLYTPFLDTEEVAQGAQLHITERCGTNAGTCIKYESIPPQISKMIHYASDLNTVNVQGETQLAEYVYGRMYQLHNDTYQENDRKWKKKESDIDSNRIATMLFYLEIPEPVEGGITPFITPGVFPRAVKGSAMMWYNMYRNGTIRTDIEHGSCPLLGHNKIIINHFFLYLDNWRHRQCTLNRYE